MFNVSTVIDDNFPSVPHGVMVHAGMSIVHHSEEELVFYATTKIRTWFPLSACPVWTR